MDAYPVPAPVAAALLGAGYRVGGPAGVGAGGPVWTATRVDAGTGTAPGRVVVQVVTLSDEEARSGLTERLDALWALEHPHLPEVVDVVAVPGDRPGVQVSAVLLGEVPGATVAALLAARGRLSAGEVVTLAVPVAGALDALHRSGLVHGDVSPANVVVRPDGRPVLIDVLGGLDDAGGSGSGLRRTRGTPGFTAPELHGERGTHRARAGHRGDGAHGAHGAGDGASAGRGLPPDAPADVFALGSLALAALDLAAHGGRLGAELHAACATDPVRRPTAAELAIALYACAQPEPVVQPDAGVLARAELAQLAAPTRTVSVTVGGRHRARARGGGRGRWLAVAVAVVAASGAAWTVVAQVEPGSSTVRMRTPMPTPTSAPARAPGASPGAFADDPVAAAVDLTRRRAEILAAGDPAGLAAVVEPGSPADVADRALLDGLTESQVTLDGMAAVVAEASLLHTPDGWAPGDGPPADGTRADVRVRSGITAHVRRSPSGTSEVPAQAPRAVVLRLVWTDVGWRVAEVLRS